MIGNVVATLLLTFVIWIGYQSTLPEHSKPGPSLPLPVSMGKERFTGRTRDASTYTQTLRRKAVVSGSYGNPCHVLRETNHTSGFTNGVLELYSISGLCETACKLAAQAVTCDIYDGGNAGSEYQDILDGGTSADRYDGGNVFVGDPNVLDGNSEIVMDGGTVSVDNPNVLDGSGEFVTDGGSAYFAVLNYMLLNGGNSQTSAEDQYDGGTVFVGEPNVFDGNGEFVMDGGSAYFTMLNYMLLNGGNSQTIVCQPSNNVRQPC